MTNMKHKDILTTAQDTLTERGQLYGPVDVIHDDIAKIATLLLNKSISTYDIAMIHVATKLARMKSQRNHQDSYIDAINYLSFAAEFSNNTDTILVAMEDELVKMTRDVLKEPSDV